MADSKIRKSDQFLAAFMDVNPGPDRFWRPEELGAILEHQLGAPIGFDLRNLDKGSAAKLRTLSESEGLLLNSFADVLFHPHPPV